MKIEVDTRTSTMTIQFDDRGGPGGPAKEAALLRDQIKHLRRLEVPVTSDRFTDETARVETLMDALCKGIDIVYATADDGFGVNALDMAEVDG